MHKSLQIPRKGCKYSHEGPSTKLRGNRDFRSRAGIITRKRHRPPSRKFLPSKRLEGENVAWIPGYWAWMTNETISSGSAASGVPCHRAVNGCPAIGKRPSKVLNGFPATGPMLGRAMRNICPSRPRLSKPVPISPRLRPIKPGCPAVGFGTRVATLGAPGSGQRCKPNWIWVPSHYVWAPRGYVFVDGYWDYSINRRGVLFAPVYFDAGVYTRRDFSYSPTTVIDLGVFTDHLFLRPRYQHYYFGDYYDTTYRGAGFVPLVFDQQGTFQLRPDLPLQPLATPARP